MLRSSILRAVDFCNRYAWWVIVVGVAMAAASSVYTVRHFAIKTDVKDLFPRDLPWTQRAYEYMKAFPQPEMLVVVDAPTPELVDQASTKLAEALAHRPDRFRAVHEMQGGPFFQRNGLLYLPESEVASLTQGLVQADPLLQTLAADPSLRGALGALDLGLMGLQYGQILLDDLARVLLRIHQDRDLEIVVDCPPQLAFRGERQDLEEMAGNLMDNACKWAKARVSVTAMRLEGAQFSLHVGDDGPGLDPHERTLVGERGERLDESVPGSGLGLAIVRDIAKLYGGALELDESPLGGLETRLRLPAIA